MSIVSVLEQFLERQGSGDEKAVREYKRVWKVVVDSLLDDSRTILGAPGLPNLFDLYVGSDGSVDELGATCRKLTASHAEDFVWHVEASYSNKTQQKEKGDKNPTDRPTDISANGVTFQKPVDFTPDGVAICSTTGERFDPPVVRDDSRRTYTFTRKEAQAPEAVANVYKDVVNSDTWLGYPPGTAKMGVISETRADENNIFYWKVTYPVSIDLDGWDALVIDQGTHWLDFSTNPTGDAKNFYSIHGDPLSGAQPLNGESAPLYPQGVGGNLAPGAAGTLSGTVGIGDTTIIVGVATGFPQRSSTYPIVLKVDSELMLATALSGTTFTVQRGYGGSSAGEHNTFALVQMQPYFLRFKRYRSLPFAPLYLP